GVAACPADRVVSATGQVSDTVSDAAGNTAASSAVDVRIDRTAPTIGVVATLAGGTPYVPGSWTNQPVTVHFTCADGESGVAACPADRIVSSSGKVSDTVSDRVG